MSKRWVVFLFGAWTVALMVMVPFLFSFKRSSVAEWRYELPGGVAPLKFVYTTKTPYLDWTGWMATRGVTISQGEKVLAAYDERGRGFFTVGEKMVPIDK